MDMDTPPVLSAKEWEAARQKLLVKEKALTNARDALAADRRRMPWLAVEKLYVFDGPNGKASLVDLFEGRRQLIVYRAYFEPGAWNYLDITALGRQEEWEDSPKGYPQTPPYKWWNWHDSYDDTSSSQWSSVVDCGLELQGQSGGRK